MTRSIFRFHVLAATIVLFSALPAPAELSQSAREELSATGLDKYLGDFTPISSEPVGDGWTKHTFDTQSGDGPICIAGTPYSVFTRDGNRSNLLIMLQGGGACWQDFYFCNVLAEDQEPPFDDVGIWSDTHLRNPARGQDSAQNPFEGYQVVYMPYCDGSVFTGDNDVADPSFPLGPVRYHRGLRNVSAGIDLAKSHFPAAKNIVVAGSSAGGVGASAFTPFLTRFAFDNDINLSVFNDAGPVAVNLNSVAAIQQRAADWRFGQFYPGSCIDCDDQGQATALIKWRLDNDTGIREAFYSTDGDETNRFFLAVFTQELYRELLITEHGLLHDAHPDRYKRFIRSGDDSHTALQTPLFYFGDADGTPLNLWSRYFINNNARWEDIVEDFVPVPPGE